ncbi:hypothetical protein PHMEG_00017503 [Phytophthora megakarya]|uniref:Reverse transcriptase n=1 Tax=Phytophthora megakarya TaxID=4795 RepID=A0A225VWE2_9STRA|nr:hypothetical protein PHMEG_00017503 [Phytophthora megakarya]
MAFGLTNAPMIYQRMMDNALWCPTAVGKAYSERGGGLVLKAASILDPVSELVNGLMGDMFSNGEPDEFSLFVDDICFGSETFDGYLSTLVARLIQMFTEC